jgi:AraC-like DNA-binding protein
MDSGTWDESPPRRKFDEWREMVRSSCGRLQVSQESGGAFHGDMTLSKLGQIQTSVIAADPHTVVRTHRCIDQDDEGYVYVCRMLAGHAEVTQDHRRGSASAGELIVFDNTRTFTLTMPRRFRMIVLKIPHRALGMAPRVTPPLTAHKWSGLHGMAALVSPLIISVGAHMGELEAATANQVGCSIAGMVTTLFSEHLRLTPGDPVAARHALLLRIQTYARDHLADARLTTRTLADAHHISVRHLHKLFQEQDLSPASWIRDERLKRCAADLRDPRLTHVPVALIGERWGLSAASHFSRLFRERFDLGPQEFRRRRFAELADLRSYHPTAGTCIEQRQIAFN